MGIEFIRKKPILLCQPNIYILCYYEYFISDNRHIEARPSYVKFTFNEVSSRVLFVNKLRFIRIKLC